MSYANKEDAAYLSAKSLAEDYEGPRIDVRSQLSGVFELTWTGAVATDAVVKVQESVTGPDGSTGWKDVSGKSVTIAAATGYDLIKFAAADLQSPYLRLVIVDNTESAGTVTAKYFFKGAR